MIMENNLEERQTFSKRNIFTVPEGYFETLETRIHQRTRGNKNSLWFLFKENSLKLYIAAATLALAIFLWPASETSNPEQLLAEISDEQLARYLEENTLPDQDDILMYIDYNEEDISIMDLNTLNDSIL